MRMTENDIWDRQPSENADYVFCHNDLSQHNVVVDPRSLKIQAILDWEYAGFYPEYFEAPFHKRPGPSVALNGEEDDVEALLGFSTRALGSECEWHAVLGGSWGTITDRGSYTFQVPDLSLPFLYQVVFPVF
ncbi:hypothetical protein BJX70DRAFT_396083 [Aspergillus crustosus]